jgi:hypothetical protein
MTIETAREISSNPEVIKIAKYLAQQWFQNIPRALRSMTPGAAMRFGIQDIPLG